MANNENIERVLEVFNNISKIFASMEGNAYISKPELLALEVISKDEGLMMSDIARRLEITLSTATGIMDRLIDKKLVKRERNGNDRRVVRVLLTDKGKRANQAYQDQKKEIFGRILDVLDPKEQAKLIKILEKVAIAIKIGE